MTVTLRERKMAKGMIGLYLDIYHQGKRRREVLPFKLYAQPKTQLERNHNKEARELAKRSLHECQLKEMKTASGFMEEFSPNTLFLQYFEEMTNERYTSQGNYGNWDSVLKILSKYCSPELTFGDITSDWVKGFKEFLSKVHRTKAGKPLSQNSKASYFNKLRACFKQALRDRMIPRNPCDAVKGFKMDEDHKREFLTLEELRQVAATHCDSEVLKRAFLFACLTGLRWSDAMKLTWSDFHFSDSIGNFIRFQQQKTKGQETLPVNEQAFEIIGKRGEDDRRIFDGLKYSTGMNYQLQRWILRAGISKNITFHCARHTFATLQLTSGTDIYTVSKLLGHKHLKTTEIYTQIIDQKKKQAIDNLPDIF